MLDQGLCLHKHTAVLAVLSASLAPAHNANLHHPAVVHHHQRAARVAAAGVLAWRPRAQMVVRDIDVAENGLAHLLRYLSQGRALSQ